MEQIEEKKELEELKNLSGGLEILVGLAEKGEINPWDIDIIQITDKYLAALDKSPRENLLNAGRAIFFASVLLRLKSDILLNISNETLLASKQSENFFPEDELLLEHDGKVHLDISKLESFLVRSSLGKQQRKRNISLSDLIFALHKAEEEEERRLLRAKIRAERTQVIVTPDFPEDVLQIAYEEDIGEITKKIEAVIQEHLTEDKPITLSFLYEIINDRTKPFLALLFLAHSGKVVLEQKEFYSEVFIYKAGTITEEEKLRQKDEVKRLEEIKQKARKKHKKKKRKKEAVETNNNPGD